MVEAKLGAGWVPWADVVEDAVSDARHVRALGEVVAAAAGPDEYVVGEVAHDAVGVLLGGGQAAAERRDVLVVPRVAVRYSRPVRYSRDLSRKKE